MSIESRYDHLHDLAGRFGDLLYPSVGKREKQILVRIKDPKSLTELAGSLNQEKTYLVTVVANDERELEDNCFKIYYVFSDMRADLFLIVKYILKPEEETYPSIYDHFPAVEAFE